MVPTPASKRAEGVWKPVHSLASVCLLLLVVLAGCGGNWQAAVVAPDGSAYFVDRGVLEGLSDLSGEAGSIPLERVLWMAGHYAVERLVLTDAEGARHVLDWAPAAEDAWWHRKGRVEIGGETFRVTRIEVEAPALLDEVEAYLTDVAAVAAAALGLPTPAAASRRVAPARAGASQALEPPRASHVLLLFLDGFGYLRYTKAREAGLVPNLAALPEPLLALSEYPPSTRVGTAAMLTGAPSQVNGVDGRSVRDTELETLFDVASAAGLDVVAVEGEALAFNLRNASVQLSGDRDGDGSTDDNGLANALAVLDAGMPDLLLVHFHGIDDAGHTYGPGAPEEESVIREVDAAVGQILERLPTGTLVLIFADHGMHPIQGEDRLGNHGHLIERDIFVPLVMVAK